MLLYNPRGERMPRSVAPWEAKREMLVKADDRTDPSFGCKPEERPAQENLKYGLINLDKPAGPTSHEVAAWVKRILKLSAVGHGGTLDPKVTGVLPVTLLEATKVVQALLFSGKEYVCLMKLHGDASEPQVRKVLKEFEDMIYQRPPLRSSVKRQLRTRRIFYSDFHEMEGRNVLFTVGCEGGTYIRKLCFDIGEVLGCGAHMQELRRTRAGPFVEKDAVTLQEVAYSFMEWQESKDDKILKRFVQPMERALALVSKIYIRDSAVGAVCHGANLTAPGVLSLEGGIKQGSLVAVFSLKGEAVALAESAASSEQIVDMNHGVVARVSRVLMPRSTYPKCWKSGEKTDEQKKQ
jgi:H/ACA ribonucleoprotein complex subunit 4